VIFPFPFASAYSACSADSLCSACYFYSVDFFDSAGLCFAGFYSVFF